MVETLAIIPARGGSKGIEYKNLRQIGGTSLLGLAIQSARKSAQIDQVLVSTEDEEIANEARYHDCRVADRPERLAGDSTPTKRVLDWHIDRLTRSPNTIALIQCTTPGLRGMDIDKCVRFVREKPYNSAFTATRSHFYRWEAGVNEDKPSFDRSVRKPRQHQEGHLIENGGCYAFNIQSFVVHNHRFPPKTKAIEMPEERSIDIDTRADLAAAREVLS